MVAAKGVEPMKDAYQASIIPFNYAAGGGIDGCCPRYLLRDREPNLLFFFNPEEIGGHKG